MSFQGDYAPNSVVNFTFTTVGTQGLPTALSGPTVRVFQNALSSSAGAGVTIVANFASTTGLNAVTVDTSQDQVFYAAGNDYNVIVTVGTVSGTSVSGYTVGSFSLNNRSIRANVVSWSSATVAVPATAGVPDVNVKNVSNIAASTSVALLGVNVVTWEGGTPAPLAGSGSNLVQTTVSGGGSNVNVIQWNGMTVANMGSAGSVPVVGLQIPSANFNTTGGFGPGIIRSALAATSSTATTMILDAGASSTDNFYNGNILCIVSGTGVNQVRQIINYTGATKAAVVNIAASGNTQAQGQAWSPVPDGTSTFVMNEFGVQGIAVPNNFSVFHLDTNGRVDIGNINGVAAVTSSAQLGVNIVTINGAAADTSQASLGVNVSTWLGAVPAALAGSGGNLVQAITSGGAQSNVNVVQWNGTSVNGTVPPDAVFVQSAAAQSGSSSTTITLVSGSATTNNFYNGELIFLRSGLGAGESATITAYNATTKVATVSPAWAVNPSGGDTYTIQAFAAAALSTIQQANIVQVNGTPTSTSTALFGVNVVAYAGSPVLFPTVAGVPQVDVEDIAGVGVNTNTAQLGVNLVNIRGSAAVTSTAQLGVNLVTISGAAVNTSVAQIGSNLVSWNGTPAAGTLPPDSIFTPGQAAATLQSGSSATSVTLASGSSNVTDFYKFQSITLKSGLGTGETAIIVNYNAATKVATINGTWAQQPSGGDAYFLIGEGQSVGGTSGVSGVNVIQWSGGNVPAPNVTGEPLVDINHWRGTQPNTLVSNRVDASVGNMQAGVLVSTAIGAGAFATVNFATNFFTSALIDPTGGATMADDLLDRTNAIETGITPRLAWRYIAAAEGGKTSGAATPTFTIQGINTGTNRLVATTDQSGNRSAVVLS